MSNEIPWNQWFCIVMLVYQSWLVVWNMFIFPYIGNVIIPNDKLIFFRGVGIPPTRILHIKATWIFKKMDVKMMGFLGWENGWPSMEKSWQELGSLGIRCVNAIDETKRPRFVEVSMSCGWGHFWVVGSIVYDPLIDVDIIIYIYIVGSHSLDILRIDEGNRPWNMRVSWHMTGF